MRAALSCSCVYQPVHTPFLPLALVFGNLPIQVRLALIRLLQGQSDLRIVDIGTNHDDLSAATSRLRLGLIGKNQAFGLKQLAWQWHLPLCYGALNLVKWANKVPALNNLAAYINKTIVQKRFPQRVRTLFPVQTAF